MARNKPLVSHSFNRTIKTPTARTIRKKAINFRDSIEEVFLISGKSITKKKENAQITSPKKN
jgi:hypothetical protein